MPRAIATDFNNADLLRRLTDNGVSFLLVGGGAVALTVAVMTYTCRSWTYLLILQSRMQNVSLAFYRRQGCSCG